MKRNVLIILAVLFGSLAFPHAARAHETITVGDYAVEFGWVNEPAIAGQPNAVVINISLKDAASNNQTSNMDVSGLKIQAVYGGQTKILALQPLGEDTPGQFIAPMTPTRPGIYTIHLGGNIGLTTFNTDVKPEEVQTADLVQFPAVDLAQENSSTTPAASQTAWISIAGLVLGGLGTILALIALARRPAKS